MTGCTTWKDRLLEAALASAAEPALEEHLRHCADCAAELAVLRARRERLDTLFPLVTGRAEPPPHFRARVMAATEAAGTPQRFTSRGRLALAAVVPLVVTMMVGWAALQRHSGGNALRDAQTLAMWKAPSDVLLEPAGRRFRGQHPG